MKRLSALLILLALPACSTTPRPAITMVTTTTSTSIAEVQIDLATPDPCIMYVPHADFDPDGAAFEIWADDYGPNDLNYSGNGYWEVVATGEIIGYAAAEDDAIWNEPECGEATNRG